MTNPVESFGLLKGALNSEDLAYLKAAVREHITAPDGIPSYVLLEKLDAPVAQKIKAAVEAHVGFEMLYLNDFYLFSNTNFGAHWHMDTELFTFEECLNAWILLSPEEISSPLGVASELNNSPEDFYHSMKADGDNALFANYRTGAKKTVSVQSLEDTKVNAPDVAAGDILLLNPKKFHKTNTTVPKHAIIIKYVIRTEQGVLSKTQVPAMFWKETGLFNAALKQAATWDDMLGTVREKLHTPDGRTALSAGFFPNKMDLYREMVETL